MELRHLRYFVAVAEEQNVTRAAARLFVSQPPLTRQIRDLEEELGVALFERTGKSIALTDAGRLFLEEARDCLARVDQAVARVRSFAGREAEVLNIGYAPSPTVEILPRIMKRLKEAYPGLKIQLHDHSSPEMLAGLREGSLQAALMVEPTRRALSGLKFQPLIDYPMVLAVSPDHPWSGRSWVKVSDAVKEPVVAYAREIFPDYHELLARTLGAKVRKLQFAEECDSGLSLIAAVESGKGVCFTASILERTAGRRLSFVPLRPALPAVGVGISWSRSHASPATLKLVEVARSSAVTG